MPRIPDAEYLGRRLAYDQEPEAPFDPLGNFRVLAQFARHALQYLTVYLLGAFAGAGLLLILHLAGLRWGTAATIGAVGAAVAAIALGCLFWLPAVTALLSEWKFSVTPITTGNSSDYSGKR